ncbi:MAG: hypothetical protein SNJ71_03505 [Bacteroidales bacterium]
MSRFNVQIEKSWNNRTYLIFDEMKPRLDKDSLIHNLMSEMDVILTINHLRITLYNGINPIASLMDIKMTNMNNPVKPIWIARVQTLGNSISGPTGSRKISKELVNLLVTDGFIKAEFK